MEQVYIDYIVRWIHKLYPTQAVAESVSVLSLAVVGVLVLGIWLRSYQGRSHPVWMPLLATGAVVFLVPLHLYLQSFNYGAADQRCHLYDGGQLSFELQQPPLLLDVDPGDPFSPKVLLLVVRAAARWGDEIHTCSLLANSAKGRQVMAQFGNVPMERSAGEGGGKITFTFGNGIELPNVTFQPDYYPEDKGPPEEPDEAL